MIRRLARRRPRPPIVESVQAWCEARPDVACTSLRPSEVTVRNPPRTLEPAVDDRFFTVAGREYTVPERYLARVGAARLIGDAGLVVLPDGGFSSELVFDRAHLEQQPAYLAPLPRKARRQQGNYFSLLYLWSDEHNYYHWIHDALLRLHLILPHLPPDTRFLVQPNLSATQRDSLAMLGIGPERLVTFAGDELWELETLFFAPPAARSGSNSPAALAWFRDLAWSHFGLTPGTGSRRVYISRRHTRRRRVANEPDVEAVLRSFGFETYLFETLTFREQVALLSETGAIAATSGAALTNIVFAPPGLKVCVLVEPVQISHVYWTMSEALGHEYWYVLGDTVHVPNAPPQQDLDVLVDPEKLARTLRTMFGPDPTPSALRRDPRP